MKPTLKSLLAATALTLSGSALFAGQTIVIEQETVQVSEKDWRIDIGLNSWLTAMKGDIGIGRFTTKIDYDIGKTLEHLDFAYMGTVEVGYKRWSLSVDGIYAEFSGHTDYHYGPIHGDASVKLKQALITGRLQYLVFENETWRFDAFAGVRWTYLNSTLNVNTRVTFDQPALQSFNRSWSRRFEMSRDFFDPIIGGRAIVNLPDDWFLQFSGDIGGFDVSSKLTWQLFGAVGYNFTPHVGVLGGYRALGIDYDRDNLMINTVTHGPLVSLIIRF